jgi:hypothetical protein
VAELAFFGTDALTGTNVSPKLAACHEQSVYHQERKIPDEAKV